MGMVVRVSERDDRVSDRRRYRLAGWAALAAAAAFLVQPLSVGFLPFNLEEMRDPVALSEYWWAGALQAVEFAAMACAALVLVTALHSAVSIDSMWRRLTFVMGTITGVGLLLQSALSAATYSWWLMQDASAFTPDPEVRSAVLFGTFVAGYTFLGSANLATAGWLVGLVLALREAGLAGAVFTVFGMLVAAALLVGTVAGFTIPTVLLHLPLWVVLGIKLLRAGPAETSTMGR